jgi:hypothetical protein
MVAWSALERLFVLGRGTRREWVCVGRRVGQWTRLAVGFLEWLIRRRDGIDGWVGLHDGFQVNGNVSPALDVQRLFLRSLAALDERGVERHFLPPERASAARLARDAAFRNCTDSQRNLQRPTPQ